uniref:Uncharacterized protein n=1 Tax=Chlamydomonas euryale TaxID=1486919 RepID=A0A7R9YRF7_9CHLO|mmetsp:Transcript_14032/g.40747  ORF Transcript_14032/g.40747 Transcript_14032/m.40747 type:complete len:173 (+) Transcript_14032:235-753(+)
MPEYDAAKESTVTLQARLARHVLMKGFQAGSFVGVVAAVPIQALLTRSISLPKVVRAAGISSIVGTGLTGAMLANKMQSIDREGYEDRVYRLYYNEGQNHVDEVCSWATLLGLAGGFALSSLGLAPATGLHFIGSAATGSAAGLLAAIMTMPAKHAKPVAQMVEDHVKLPGN